MFMNKPSLLLISNSTLHGSGYLDHCATEIGSFLEDKSNVLFVPLHGPEASLMMNILKSLENDLKKWEKDSTGSMSSRIKPKQSEIMMQCSSVEETLLSC